MDLDRHVDSRLRALAPGAAIRVGLSGGLDSVVLLDVLARLAPPRGHAVGALHVHHGLSPNADAWEAFCRELCAGRGIPISVERVRVPRHAPEGLEAAARAARYAAYRACGDPVVALAHHLDDQAETLLLQLVRGTGLKGASAMPELRVLADGPVRLFRPLLGIRREALRAHALGRGLAWIEDESNASPGPDRNFIRHDVAPRLDARFPGWREAAARFARHAAQCEALLAEMSRIDGAPERAGEGLRVEARLPAARRANALRAFLAMEGLPMPSAARLSEMARQLYEAREDARVRIAHGGATLVRHRGTVQVAWVAPQARAETAWRIDWHGEAEVDLGPRRGHVRFERTTGAGLRLEAPFESGEWHFAFRHGGERIRLDAARPSRTLKNLLRESAVPEWERERLPLLFHAQRVAWVPGIGVAAEFACAPGMPGLVPAWCPPGRSGAGD